jgi:hypothetical protein
VLFRSPQNPKTPKCRNIINEYYIIMSNMNRKSLKKIKEEKLNSIQP